MKYIKRIDELQKSTYVSAAMKLRDKHVSRSEDLIKYAREKGEPKKIDRIYHHKFNFTNKSVDHFSNRLHPDEIFFISEIKLLGSQRYDRYYGYYYLVTFDSNYNSKIILRLIIFTDGDISMSLNRISTNYETASPGNPFLFINRKDAVNFKRAILEIIEDESEDDKELEIFKATSINKMYTSN